MQSILIVDDDEVTRLTYGKMFIAKGYEVAYAQDGELAVKYFDEHRHDVVIVDLVMPKKNGFKVIEEIRTIDRNARIIAISGKSPEYLHLALEKGAMKVMVKPVDLNELIQAVQTARRVTRGWDSPIDFR